MLIGQNTRNLLLNGNFDFFQRTTSSTTGIGQALYIADRWYYLGDSSNVGSQGSQSVISNINGFKFQTSTAGVSQSLSQALELKDTILLRGKTVTVSFSVLKTVAPGAGTLQVDLISRSDLEGKITNGTLATVATLAAFQPSLTETRYTLTGVVPSNALSFGVKFTSSLPGTTSDIVIRKCMMNIGEGAADFERRGVDYTHELQLCQRYYEKSYSVDVLPNTVDLTGSIQSVALSAPDFYDLMNTRFKVEKRVVPTMGLYNPGSAAPGTIWNLNSSTTAGNSGVRANSLGTTGFSATCVNSALAVNNGQAIHFTADAEL